MRLVFALYLLITSITVLAFEKTANVIAIEYPPFVAQADEGYGISGQLLQQQLASAGWTAKVKFYPPARALKETETNRWLLSFYPPLGVVSAPSVVLGSAKIHYGLYRKAQETAFTWESLTELKGKKVATIRSGTDTNNVDSVALTEAGVAMVYIDTIEQGVLMLKEGRVDFLLTAVDTGRYYAQKNNIDPDDLQFTEKPFRTYPHMIYINLDHPRAEQLLSDLSLENEYSDQDSRKVFSNRTLSQQP